MNLNLHQMRLGLDKKLFLNCSARLKPFICSGNWTPTLWDTSETMHSFITCWHTLKGKMEQIATGVLKKTFLLCLVKRVFQPQRCIFYSDTFLNGQLLLRAAESGIESFFYPFILFCFYLLFRLLIFRACCTPCKNIEEEWSVLPNSSLTFRYPLCRGHNSSHSCYLSSDFFVRSLVFFNNIKVILTKIALKGTNLAQVWIKPMCLGRDYSG